MFSVCFYLQRRQGSMQTDKKRPPPPPPPPPIAVEASQLPLLLSATVTNARRESPQRAAAEPLPQELIQHFSAMTDLYLPPAVTRLQTAQRFISVTFPLS